MSSNAKKLEETQQALSDFQKLNDSLTEKIAKTKEMISREKRTKYSLKLELAQLQESMENIRQEIEKMDKERNNLSRIHTDLVCISKRVKNFEIIKNMRLESKRAWMVKLQDQLATYDFTIEQRQEDRSNGISSLTQIPGA